ncbi:PaaI family thioesterase [Desulfoprunum benzoelyticum]|uniref:Medium/long-chain acyl-CoA thioesterase YigI n=1 Tax=Desulfoprunum benzoelyticum TaxID=1506996 RepID=A0A840UTV9_9BACT|nr:PaaI family thioesterase [Desulfoprunum benzoelyticum]MBB5348183.1 uncharacterized protein (TIGR00369 family) [Desulfoprunum benzoelyticum]MBM9530889.1 PaaI family thioesterase [Desulfoprunum benzoelyticum]
MENSIARRIRDSFARQSVMTTIGATLTAVENGAVTVELPFRSDLTQQHGFLHAGVVTMIVDSACGYAALTMMPASAAVLTAEYKVNFLSPAEGEKLIARGRVLKPGRTLTVCFGEVHAVRDGQEKLVATMMATMVARQDTGLTD